MGDLHPRSLNPAGSAPRLSLATQVLFALFGIALVPVCTGAPSIVQPSHGPIGALTAPILSAFAVAFVEVDARAVIAMPVVGTVASWPGASGWPVINGTCPDAGSRPWHFVHVGAIAHSPTPSPNSR